jgi:hypothetical protein
MNGFMGVLKGLAPTVASAVLGPLGGVAVAAIGEILGIDNATTVQISKAFEDGKITPEQLAEIKKMELRYQNEEKERGFRYSEMEFKDRDSARQLAKVDMRPQMVLSVIYTVGYFTLLYQFISGDLVIPLQNKDLLGPLIGVMGAAQVQIMNFWFGSSAGSTTKNTMLAGQNA